jgi:hypothetical protein
MTSDSAAPVRVALLLSGHLRDVCRDEYHFEPLRRTVADCRSLAVCDLFIATWDVLFPRSPTATAAAPSPANHSDLSNRSLLGTSSLACLAQIQLRLRPEAISVDSQPPDIVPRYGNATWWRREEDRPVLSVAGLRSYVYAAAAASHLKRRHCAVFECGAYAIAVRCAPAVAQARVDRRL